MPDKYPNFETLSRNERSGVDFRIVVRQAGPEFAVVAPHGGGIEEGTSEIADAIAGEEVSSYSFEGLKSKNNSDLHITSTLFDEPMCLNLLGVSDIVLTIHGERSVGEAAKVFIGGLDSRLGRRVGTELKTRGFVVGRHSDRNLQGLEEANICNRGTSGKGVQLEISRGIREEMFKSLSRNGRKHTTARFKAFVKAIRAALKL